MLDTRTLTNGLHTIAWVDSHDDAGKASRRRQPILPGAKRIMNTRRAFFGALSALATSAADGRGAAAIAAPRPNPRCCPDAELKLVRRITNGLTLEEIASVYAYGYNGYIDMQLNPAAIDDSACDARLAPYTAIGLPTPQLYALDSTTVQTQVIESTILRAIYSKRQLFERMVEFWTDHFNTDINTVGILKTADVRDVLRGHALGTFPAMLKASAASPAMINRLEQPAELEDRAQPELRARGDGAAHARRQRRLHPAGHRRGRALLHRLALQQHDQRPDRGTFLFNQSVHDTGTKLVLGQHRSPAAAASTKG